MGRARDLGGVFRGVECGGTNRDTIEPWARARWTVKPARGGLSLRGERAGENESIERGWARLRAHADRNVKRLDVTPFSISSTRTGDWFAWFCVAMFAVLLACGFLA